jgi:hypothetical protein
MAMAGAEGGRAAQRDSNGVSKQPVRSSSRDGVEESEGGERVGQAGARRKRATRGKMFGDLRRLRPR